jgi:hypothetical protein
MARRPGGGGDPDPQHHQPDSEPQQWAEACRLAVNPGVSASLARGTALMSVFGRRRPASVGVWAAVRPGRGSDARLGLYAPGGDRVGQCRVVAFGLVGVGLAEVGHGLVELV